MKSLNQKMQALIDTENIKEVIVIDENIALSESMPDIDKTLNIEGCFYKYGIQKSVDGYTIQGVLRVRMVYTTEEGEVCTFSQDILVSEEKKHNFGEFEVINLFIKVERCTVDGTPKGKRKVAIKATIYACISVIKQNEYEFISEFEDEKVQSKKHTVEGMFKGYHTEEKVSLSEICTIENIMNPIGEIIWYNVYLSERASSINHEGMEFTSKMIVDIIYKTQNDENDLEKITLRVPISIKCEEAVLMPGGKSFITASLYSLEVVPKEDIDGEKTMVQIECEINLNIETYQLTETQAVVNAYSTTHETKNIYADVEFQSLKLESKKVSLEVNNQVELDEENIQIEEILGVSCVLKNIETVCENNQMTIKGEIKYSVLYTNTWEDDYIKCVRFTRTFSHTIKEDDLADGAKLHINIHLEDIQGTIKNEKQIDVYTNHIICYELYAEKKYMMLQSMEEISDKAVESPCGIIVYFTKPGDTAWDIAKKYKIKEDDLKIFNGIKEDIVPGKKLYII